jgi:hypothetical protein
MDDYSNAVRFPITKLVFLDRADRQRAAALLLDDRALYDPALGMIPRWEGKRSKRPVSSKSYLVTQTASARSSP